MHHTVQAKRSGFTVVELVIVMVVIAILFTLVAVGYNGVQRSARHVTLINDLSNGSVALNLIARRNGGVYPTDMSNTGVTANTGNTFAYSVSSDDKQFCLQNTGYGETYYVTNAFTTARQGTCPPFGGSLPPAPTYAGPILASSSFAPIGSGKAPSVTLPLPSGATTGSLLIIHVFAEYCTTQHGSVAGNLIVPNSFTMAYSINANEFSNTFQELAGVYYTRVAPGQTSYTIGYTPIGSIVPNDEWAAASLIIGGAATGSPFVDSFEQVIQEDNVSNNFTLPGFNVGGNNSLVYVAVGDPGNIIETTYGAQPGWTKSVGGDGTGYYGTIYYRYQTTAGPIGDSVFTSDRNDGKYVIVGTLR